MLDVMMIMMMFVCLQTVARRNASSSALMKVASAINRENEGGNNDIFDAKEQVLLGLKTI